MKNIFSKIILFLIVIGIVLGIAAMVFLIIAALNEPSPEVIIENDDIIPYWFLQLLMIIIAGTCISFPIAVLCIIYFLIKGKPKHEE